MSGCGVRCRLCTGGTPLPKADDVNDSAIRRAGDRDRGAEAVSARMAPRTLSKSRFKLAVECPTKVFYSLDRRYVNSKDEDEFLQALADGGFQAGPEVGR